MKHNLSTKSAKLSIDDIGLRTVGERLAFLRKNAGLNLVTAAEETGLSSSELSRIENNSRRLTKATIEKMAVVYGLDSAFVWEAVRYQNPSKLVRLVSNEKELAAKAPDKISCYGTVALSKKGRKLAPTYIVEIPAGVKLSKNAYAIEVDDSKLQDRFPIGSILVADPNSPVRLGDLTVNTQKWDPLVLVISRNSEGALIGTYKTKTIEFDNSVKLSDFDKIKAVFTA